MVEHGVEDVVMESTSIYWMPVWYFLESDFSLKLVNQSIIFSTASYSPELNPAKKMWAKFKRGFTNKLFHSLEQISHFIDDNIKTIEKQYVIAICACNHIFFDSFWNKI